jgi:hypothetical protein
MPYWSSSRVGSVDNHGQSPAAKSTKRSARHKARKGITMEVRKAKSRKQNRSSLMEEAKT